MEKAEIMTPSTDNIKDEVIQYIEKMDEYQLRFILSLIKKLFRLPD